MDVTSWRVKWVGGAEDGIDLKQGAGGAQGVVHSSGRAAQTADPHAADQLVTFMEQ
jgi:hypothetical protein